MKNPDSPPPMDSNLPEKVEGELLYGEESDSLNDSGPTLSHESHESHESNPESSQDPITVSLDQTFQDEIDDERLYTDAFIRANENASRSLFLGFLGAALLGTSLIAWIVLSQSDQPTQPATEPRLPVPAEAIPNLDPNSNPNDLIPGSQRPNNSSPGAETQPPIFPVNPINPAVPNNDSTGTTLSPQLSPRPESSPLLVPEGTLVPPPPPNESPSSTPGSTGP